MPMVPEYWNTPLRCENGHTYEDEVLWKIHYVAQLNAPTNQVAEIVGMTCQDPNYPNCDAPIEVADGWTPYPPAR